MCCVLNKFPSTLSRRFIECVHIDGSTTDWMIRYHLLSTATPIHLSAESDKTEVVIIVWCVVPMNDPHPSPYFDARHRLFTPTFSVSSINLGDKFAAIQFKCWFPFPIPTLSCHVHSHESHARHHVPMDNHCGGALTYTERNKNRKKK